MAYVVIATINGGTHTEKIASFKYRGHAEDFLDSDQWGDITAGWEGFVDAVIVDSTIRRARSAKAKVSKFERARAKAQKFLAKASRAEAKLAEAKAAKEKVKEQVEAQNNWKKDAAK